MKLHFKLYFLELSFKYEAPGLLLYMYALFKAQKGENIPSKALSRWPVFSCLKENLISPNMYLKVGSIY